MASRDITTSTGAGVPLNSTQHDQNLNSLAGTVEEQVGTTYLVVYTDQGKTIQLNNATMTCTMDAIATIAAAIDTDKWMVRLKNINAAAATIARSSTDTFDGATSLTLAQYESVVLQINAGGTAWNIVGEVKTARLATATYDPAGIAEQVVGLDATQTLTNKTLTSPVINVTSDAQGDTYQRDGSGSFARLAIGTAGQRTRVNAAGTDLEYGGGVVQTVSTTNGTRSALSGGAVSFDNNTFLITEGDEVMTRAITPYSTSNTLEINVIVNVANSSANNEMVVGIFNTEESATDALAVGTSVSSNGDSMFQIAVTYRVTAPSTSANTYSVRVGANSGTSYFNGNSTASDKYAGAVSSSIVIKEYAA